MQEMASPRLDFSVLYMYLLILLSYWNAALLGSAVIIRQTTEDEREGLEGKGLQRDDLKRLAFVSDVPKKHLDFTEPPAVVIGESETLSGFFSPKRNFSSILSCQEKQRSCAGGSGVRNAPFCM